jgi:type II secretory pathway component PulK
MKLAFTASSERTHHRRQGALLVFAMIALLVSSMLAASLLKSSITAVRQLEREHWQLQAEWLADAGCQRALYRLRTEPDFRSEEWTIASNPASLSFDGVVRITIAPETENSGQWKIAAAAEYPKGTTDAVRVRKAWTVARTSSESRKSPP